MSFNVMYLCHDCPEDLGTIWFGLLQIDSSSVCESCALSIVSTHDISGTRNCSSCSDNVVNRRENREKLE